MESAEKVKISAELIFTKILTVAGILLLFLLVQDYKRISTEKLTEYILLIIILSALLVYFFTRAAVFFDSGNLYIKKYHRQEIVVPLKNIKSVKEDFFTSLATRGINFYVVKYITLSGRSEKIKFQVAYDAENIAAFIAQTKKVNPTVNID
ncbi:hypothetical protein [Ferruginibacter profundus]